MRTGTADDPVISLYVHIPFCLAKCGYCDFNSFAGLDTLFTEYTSALQQEIEGVHPAQVRTIFFGGGTPTVLLPSDLSRILTTARRHFQVDALAEISIEANPCTIDLGKLRQLRAEGINRLSLGVQSFDDQELQVLGRIHTAVDAIQAVQSSRLAGFENLSLDLLYGLPQQTLASWQHSLRMALELAPDHLSLYALTVEEGTPLSSAIAGGELPLPDPDLAADMYELAQDLLRAAGFVHYEISNWSRLPSLICRHNLTYWRNQPYLGVGAGAHSWLNGKRWSNTASPADYIHQVSAGRRPVSYSENIPQELEMSETLMLGLRLLDEGVSFDQFEKRFGLPLREKYACQVEELTELGLIQASEKRLRLSGRGRLLGNQVFLKFLPD
jgi:oxygen-independent coproporphyrinogen-3 oxidase